VRITRVYTRTGDDGTTRLGSGQKVPKDALRIEAYGTADELNSVIGLALAGGLDEGLRQELVRIQNELFDVGSDLCILEEDKAKGAAAAKATAKRAVRGVEKSHVDRLEAAIDKLQADLGPLEEFILPGGSTGAALLHVARTVCRRAERLVVRLAREEAVGAWVVPYLNRLSDLLFVMARRENQARGVADVYWKREAPPPAQ
jgi:cob(I)alamin adenosyltransferase